MNQNIEIDLNNLVENLVNCEEFCILQLLFKQQETLLDKYVNDCGISIYTILNDLVDKGYIITTKEHIDFQNKETIKFDKPKCYKLFGIDGGVVNFYKFFSTYPQKVPARNGGYRALRPAGVDSKQGKALAKKYFAKVGKAAKKQEHVQEVLELELEARRKSNALIYLPAMEAYLNGFKWESYEYLLTEKKTINESVPRKGEQLI